MLLPGALVGDRQLQALVQRQVVRDQAEIMAAEVEDGAHGSGAQALELHQGEIALPCPLGRGGVGDGDEALHRLEMAGQGQGGGLAHMAHAQAEDEAV